MRFANKERDLNVTNTSSQETVREKKIVDSETSLQVKLQSHMKDRLKGTGFGSGVA